ncbi:hypothetical protein GIB67_036899 [Kingdonia uniflora]|uniref:DUF868 family protein n=1 Tax=Kingdonia uniflora TaxID=39325 RepID=A0A7J7NVJ8_9MAGN|nr:hypothetical protein GIB67_036899 [Kingdonia uniflora]
MTDLSSSFSCFRPTSPNPTNLHPSTPPVSNNPNLTTCLYNTDLGVIALTWCRHVIGRSLHIDIDDFETTPSFHLQIKPLLFWKKNGSKRIQIKSTKQRVEIYWDLNKARFQSGGEPQSGFYVSVVVDGEMVLMVGDLSNEAYVRTKARKPERPQSLILRREHVFGNKSYTTKANFGGKVRDISIDCSVVGDEPRLCFGVDGQRVLLVKRLKWKFRGNEKIEVDGVQVHVSWDVFNWLFEEGNGGDNGHAVFMFRFEKMGFEKEEFLGDLMYDEKKSGGGKDMVLWQPQQHKNHKCSNGYFGMNGFERKKLKKSSFKSRSSSSSSISSASSSSSSSVMEWASMEENELLQNQSGFSLMVYAWKS